MHDSGTEIASSLTRGKIRECNVTVSDSRGIHEEVDDGVDDGVGHGEPVEGQEDVLHKDRLHGTLICKNIHKSLPSFQSNFRKSNTSDSDCYYSAYRII